MFIKRFYTKHSDQWNADLVFQNINFRLVDSVIRTASGDIVSQLNGVEVPDFWSQTAADIFATKYLRRAGVPNKLERVTEEGVPEWLQCSQAVEDATLGRETSIKQVANRLAGCWTYHGWTNDYFENEEEAKIFFDETRYMILHQIAAPNSPQWFNTGLYWAYGIAGQAGNQYHLDPKAHQIVKSTSAYRHPQVHACFILEVRDDLINKNGIMDTIMQEAIIFKYGSGAGANFSSIRGTDEKLSGGGVSSGLLSFLEVSNRSAGAIKSGGTTRRAAKMVIIDIDHPDVVEFITWKIKEEAKVLSLTVGSKKIDGYIKAIVHACKNYNGDVKDSANPERNLALKYALADAMQNGVPKAYCSQIINAWATGIDIDWEVFNLDWNSTAYRTVGGQNSNNSIRITDKFMEAVQNDADWHLIARTDGSITKTLKAKELWDLICYAAWSCADPGVQYHDTIQSWHTCKASGPIRGTNPCSEYIFLDNTACNLASINLDKMLNTDGKFTVNAFKHACYIFTYVLDISVQMAQYPTYDFAERSLQYRTLGLGYCSIGSLLMSLGLAYDSDSGRAVAANITALMTWCVYQTSSHLADRLGTFPHYEMNKQSMLNVLENMHEATKGGTEYKGLSKTPVLFELDEKFNYIKQEALQVAQATMDKVQKHGVRNAQATVIAPTGTIGLVMDCGTTSIEPTFSLVTLKKLAGGGDIKLLNRTVPNALKALNYSEKEIEEIGAYIYGYGNIDSAPHINKDSLMSKGFTQDMINKINKALRNAYDIKHIINVSFLGRDKLLEATGLDLQSTDNLLERLGFTHDEIHQANLHCCGHLSIEGAPHIKAEHENIFDCANPNGVGKKFISPAGHYKILAATQPFISGGASKTINLPEEASIDAISESYFEAWQLGIKCVALYRDNSKLSQALYTTDFSAAKKTVNTHDRIGHRYGMRLDNHAFYVLTQENEKGLLTDIDVVMGKEGSSFRTLLDCFAKAISLGLQYNIPLNKYVDAFKSTSFEPAGMVLGYKGIDKALSPLDLLARVLEKEYVNKNKDTVMHHFNLLPIDAICKSRIATAIIGEHEFKIIATEVEEAGQVKLAEVFFKMSKEGSAFCSLMSNFAKAISIALRARVPFEVIYKTFIGTKFEPHGYITGDPYIKKADSVIDFAFQCLGRWYLPELQGRYTASSISTTMKSPEEGQGSSACSKCFSFSLKQNGSCLVCTNCGETTGCS